MRHSSLVGKPVTLKLDCSFQDVDEAATEKKKKKQEERKRKKQWLQTEAAEHRIAEGVEETADDSDK